MKTIGTLEEIGAQVGDVVEWLGLHGRSKDYIEYKIWKIIDGTYYHHEDDYTRNLMATDPFRIVTRSAKSPVRTVTRKEIVPGVYGAVTVYDAGGVSIAYCAASDLTASIKTLTEIRDAMENPLTPHA